jgi:hypothetical protein
MRARKPGRKGTLGRPKNRWEDNVKIDFEETGRGPRLG